MRWHALHIFIDAFQGCYKDGTNGSRDCRYIATALLTARVLPFFIFALSPTPLFYGVAQFVFIPLAMMIAVTQPYKPHFSIYNAVDSILVPLMALWCASIVCIIMLAPEAQRWLIFVVLLFILSVLPLFYISFVILHWICCQRKVGQKMIGKIRGWIGRNTGRTITTDSDESLPDRLINPAEYEELTAPLAVQVEDKLN